MSDRLTPWQIANRCGSSGRRAETFIEQTHGIRLGYGVLTVEQLTLVPTSLLVADVARHECDLFHASHCAYCEAKQTEIDRRFPSC